MTDIAKFASLHNHSMYSDGTFQIKELIDKAHEKNIDLQNKRKMMIKGFAIVDHDFYPSESIIKEEREYASQYDIELIFGTEISADSANVHIVGYELDPTCYSIYHYMLKEQFKRVEAFEDTCRRLNRLFEKEGLSIDLYRDIGPSALKKDKYGRVIEHGPLRWHYLRQAMVERGMAKDRRDADILIGPGGPCYHQRETIDSITALDLIKDCGGIAVIAHPHQIPENFRWRVISSLIEAGIDGIEAYHKSYFEPENENIYVKLAKENNLMVLSATDTHDNIEDIERFLVPYKIFESIRSAGYSLYRADKVVN
ncbi:MAG: hypothetical protein SVZ03_11385 [Spirochaetota bacterium]|nr:hypothetical protein [Spirochaetota bacterium]